MRRYKEIEHTADIGVEIYGNTLEEVFVNAGYALFDTIVEVSTIQPTLERTVHVTGNDVETLLMNWLRELLYLFSIDEEVYTEFEIQSLLPNEITAVIKGETLDRKKHHFNTELKAVTYHQLELTYEYNLWRARVIFDV